MGLLEDLKNPDNFRRRPSTPCTICLLLEDLPADEAAELTTVLGNSKVASAGLARVLQANGHNVKADALNRHRKGDCVGLVA